MRCGEDARAGALIFGSDLEFKHQAIIQDGPPKHKITGSPVV
jgi:hypothetical protein